MLRFSRSPILNRTRHSWRRAAQQNQHQQFKGDKFSDVMIGSRSNPDTNPRKMVHRAEHLAKAVAAATNPIQEHLEEAEATLPDASAASSSSRKPFTLSAHANVKRGADVAFDAKSMSDTEWQNVPLSDKHSFVKYISQQIQTAPSEVTEMQRRRFYETTMFDPTKEDPHRTVQDAYERVKLGLPTKFVLDRNLGVPDAVYEQADAAMFDPQDASKIENAVTEIKQMFTDYVKKKKQGLSTEVERRALANATEELNAATQKHLSEMFRYAENRLQESMKEERERQLHFINRVRKAVQKHREENSTTTTTTTTGSTNKKKSTKKEQVARILRRNYGLDIETADAVCKEMNLQEQFLRECEVLARMTKGTGFTHSPQDQNLESYTSEIKNIYSMNPEQLCQIDAVQYVAAIEGVAPVDWAANWYAQSLLLPLQSTPEYKALQKIKEEERRALSGESVNEVLDSDANSKQQEEANDNNNTTTTSSDLVPVNQHRTKPEQLENQIVDLTSKMFVNPDDERLKTMHEKRLRYIAHVHMESQIKRMRENAVLFEDAQDSTEGEKVKELYAQLEKIKEEKGLDSQNVFEDEEARAVFSEIQKFVREYISRRKIETKAEKKAKKIAALAAAVASANSADVEKQVRRIRREKKREQMQRILDIVERDVRQEIHWLETFAEADRPAPLPIPEPMSYVSAGDVLAWKQQELSDREKDKGNPFKKSPGTIAEASFLGQPWPVPDKPLLFWGTGSKAVEQALKHAAEDAERRRNGEPLAPPYPCAENPWGWRLKEDPLDEPDYFDEFGNEGAKPGEDYFGASSGGSEFNLIGDEGDDGYGGNMDHDVTEYDENMQ